MVNSKGSAISVAAGIYKSGTDSKIVAITDDTAFFQNGISALIAAVQERADFLLIILDNLAAPFTQFTLPSDSSQIKNMSEIAVEDLIITLNTPFMQIIDPEFLSQFENVLHQGLECPGLSVIIVKNACALVD